MDASAETRAISMQSGLEMGSLTLTVESELISVLCVVPAVCRDPEPSRVKTVSCKITSVESAWVTGCYQRVSCLMGVHRGSVWIKEQLIKMSWVQVSSASFISQRAFWLIYALQIKKGLRYKFQVQQHLIADVFGFLGSAKSLITKISLWWRIRRTAESCVFTLYVENN